MLKYNFQNSIYRAAYICLCLAMASKFLGMLSHFPQSLSENMCVKEQTFIFPFVIGDLNNSNPSPKITISTIRVETVVTRPAPKVETRC